MGLEDLSPELKSGILDQITDLQTLKKLVRASPSFHSVYLSRRHNILKRVIKDDLGEAILPEALAVVKNIVPEAYAPDQDFHVQVQLGFLTHVGYYEDYTKLFKIEDLDPTQVEELAALHLTVEYFAGHLCGNALDRSLSLTAFGYHDLSPTERCRILRAIYRFQFFNSRGKITQSPTAPESDYNSLYIGMSASAPFVELLPQWQIEELDCVRMFFLAYYDIAFGKALQTEEDLIRHHLREESEQEVFKRLTLQKTRNKLKWLHKTSKADPMLQIDSLGDHLNNTADSPIRMMRWHLNIADHANGPAFEGDRIGAPNSAWTTVRRYDPRIISLTRLRQSNYVFWDEKRIKNWNLSIDSLRI